MTCTDEIAQKTEKTFMLNIKNKSYNTFLPYAAKSKNIDSFSETIIIIAIIIFVIVSLGFVANMVFNAEQMSIISPIFCACAIFSIFSYVLYVRTGAYLFGEIGFVYLALAMAYTISPGIKFLLLDFNFPLDFDGLNFAVLSPTPSELSLHFWRHVLFISGVAIGYLMARGAKYYNFPAHEITERKYGQIIAILIFIVMSCIFLVSFLLPPATTYLEHYTRFENISAPVRKIIDLCMIFKNGGYFVLLSMMFIQYRRFKILIFLFVPLLCTYEIVFSNGSRIVAFTIILATLGFYHFCVNPISLKKSMTLLFALAVIFSGIGFVRSFSYSFEEAQYAINRNEIKASEFEAVYCTELSFIF